MSDKHVETERKYIIKMPDVDLLREADGYFSSEIVQIYLDSAPGVIHRIRSRTFSTGTVYTETKKIRISNMSAIEDEGEISLDKFSELSMNIRTGTLPIKKTRHVFCYRGETFEIDIYPGWAKSAIMEIELDSEGKTFEIPPFIHVLCEVTGMREYSNAAMAARFPDEII